MKGYTTKEMALDAGTPRRFPVYIHPFCDACKSKLVLNDKFQNPNVDEDEIWYDEWVCPKCDDGIHLDWPEDELDELKQKADEADEGELETKSIDELLNRWKNDDLN